MLLSNPCFESISDQVRKNFTGTPTEYKKNITSIYRKNDDHFSLQNFLKENIVSLLIQEIKRNKILLDESDIFKHPELLYNKISNCVDHTRKTSTDNKEINIYEYKRFFNTLYVALGVILELSKDGSDDYCSALIERLEKI